MKTSTLLMGLVALLFTRQEVKAENILLSCHYETENGNALTAGNGTEKFRIDINEHRVSSTNSMLEGTVGEDGFFIKITPFKIVFGDSAEGTLLKRESTIDRETGSIERTVVTTTKTVRWRGSCDKVSPSGKI